MKTTDEIIDYCFKRIKDIQSDYASLQSDRVEALKFYNGDKSIVPIVKDRSQVTTSDLFDAIEWIKPAVLEIFTSSDEILSLQPETQDDTQSVKRMELLVNKQLRYKNEWFAMLYDAFSDGMLLKTGIIKYQWLKEVKYVDREYAGLNEIEYQAKIAESNFEVIASMQFISSQAQVDPESGVTIAPVVMEYNLKGRYVIEDEYPLIEAVPPEDVGFKFSARKIDNTFLYHRITYSKEEFALKYGVDVRDRIGHQIDDSSGDMIRSERLADLGGMSFFYNKEQEEFYVYECFYPHPETSQAWLTIICAEEVLLNEKNKYGRPNFEIFSPIRISHRICGKSYYDLLADIQKIRTFLLRQFLDNACMANYRRYFIDFNRVNMDDYLNNNVANAAIRVQGGDPRTAVTPEEKAQLPSEIFNLFEMINIEKDYHSGIPRSFQGVNPDILNETFRGQAQQISQASQRIQMLARLMAETFITPLVKDIIDLNLKFLQKKTMVRYLNEWIEINPDNIIGKYDIEVKVGLGTGNKALQVSQLQQVLGLYSQFIKSGLGVVTGQNVYYAIKELMRNMGYRNTSDFVTDPHTAQNIEQLIMVFSQVMQATGISDPKILELINKVAVNFGIQPQPATAQPLPNNPVAGQNIPNAPLQPQPPMQDRSMTLDGGGFWS